MTIRLTQDDVEEQYQEADEEALQFDPNDGLDITWKYDARFSQGWRREIELREGMYLYIDQSQATDRLIVESPEAEGLNIHFMFQLSGNAQWIEISRSDKALLNRATGQYSVRGNGLNNQITCDYGTHAWSSISIEISPNILNSFAASSDKELPKNLQHLVRPLTKELYWGHKNIQPMMATILQQILHCPYQGIVKRAYLESKVIELTALVLDHEIVVQQEGKENKKVFLKPEQLERIHYAKEILLRDLNNPPSLATLAHQSGLSEYMLRQGFRHCFDTTVLNVLRDYRLEMAKQILAEQNITVAEVAHRVGYASLSYFSRAFKHKFGINPKNYQKACR
ncbi:MAG: AraC family transcriptional regulator [Cyanobacteria bacterium P01_F01_bin.53]